MKPIMYEGLPVPDECPRTIKHVIVHLKSADEAIQYKDGEQARHDISVAIRLLELI